MKSKGDLFGDREAVFSSDRRYRYTLWQWWNRELPYVMFVGLNPSTADEVKNDPTVRRCINFAELWGYGGFCMTNIFAYRATDPKVMEAQEEPIGPDNDRWLKQVSNGSGLVVAAWGTHGSHLGRAEEVLALIGPLCCLGTNKDGSPKHPLYLRRDTEPVLYEGSKI